MSLLEEEILRIGREYSVHLAASMRMTRETITTNVLYSLWSRKPRRFKALTWTEIMERKLQVRGAKWRDHNADITYVDKRRYRRMRRRANANRV